MPPRETVRAAAAHRTRRLLVRIGEELRTARVTAGLGSRPIGRAANISHTQVLRMERADAPHVDVEVLVRLAMIVGCDLSVGIHPVRTPVRDASHLSLLGRFRAILPPTTE